MRVIVYGSLKKGFYNHKLLKDEGAIFIDNFISEPIYSMYSLGWYPAVVEGGDTPIFGEVYEIGDFTKLDKLEGHPKWYRRELIKTHVGDSWMYLFKNILPPVAKKCLNGAWEETC